jgi:hypothetical protein
MSAAPTLADVRAKREAIARALAARGARVLREAVPL